MRVPVTWPHQCTHMVLQVFHQVAHGTLHNKIVATPMTEPHPIFRKYGQANRMHPSSRSSVSDVHPEE